MAKSRAKKRKNGRGPSGKPKESKVKKLISFLKKGKKKAGKGKKKR